MGRRRSRLSGSLLILALFILWTCREHQATKLSAASILELSTYRPFLGRLYQETPFRPYRSSSTVLNSVESDDQQSSRGGSGREDGTWLGDRASIDLAKGRIEDARRRLEKAVENSPDDARLHNDLSVAYLERSTQTSSPMDLLAAFRHAHKASQLAPDSAATWFNLALTLERLSLVGQASAAWRRFLALDSESLWVSEVPKYFPRLDEVPSEETWEDLRGQILNADSLATEAIASAVRNNPFQVCTLVIEEILPQVAAGQVEGMLRARAGQIARELALQRGDWLLADAFEVLQARRTWGPALVEAHQQLSRGIVAYRRHDYTQARELLGSAAVQLHRVRSPLAEEAELYAAICLYQTNTAAAVAPLEESLKRVDADRYPGLAYRLRWMLGLAAMGLGQHEEATRHLLAMSDFVEYGGGEDQAVMADTLLAENFDLRGEVERGWTYRLRALEPQLAHGDLRRRHSVLLEAAQALVRRGQPEMAMFFLVEAEGNARLWGEPYARVEVLSQRSRAATLLGEWDAALHAAEEGVAAAFALGEAGEYQRLRGQVLVSRGYARVFFEPSQALADLQLGERLELATRWRNDRSLVRISSARAQIALGQLADARKNLRRSVEEYEEMRQAAMETPSRIAIFAHAMEASDLLMELSLYTDQPPYSEALAWSERSRGRSISDAWESRSTVPDPGSVRFVTDLLASLPDDRIIVEFAVLPRQTLAWVMARNQLRSVILPISSKELRHEVRRFRAALETDSPFYREIGATLYEQLIRPLGLELDYQDRIIVVPDGPLEHLPFAALLDGQRDRFLIEDVTLTLLPAARLAPGVADRTRPSDRSSGLALLVGAPKLLGTAHASLPRLPGAADEAASIAELYANNVLLLDSEATREAFLRELQMARVVHFAGHVLALEESMDAGLLLLAGGLGHESGEVSAAEIRARSLADTDLVVLAACRSLAGYSSGREGSLSVAGAFLAAGVPNVVAALWDLPDRTSPAVMLRFHRFVASGTDPPVALRQAMVESLRSADTGLSSPRSWAAFAVLGY